MLNSVPEVEFGARALSSFFFQKDLWIITEYNELCYLVPCLKDSRTARVLHTQEGVQGRPHTLISV